MHPVQVVTDRAYVALLKLGRIQLLKSDLVQLTPTCGVPLFAQQIVVAVDSNSACPRVFAGSSAEIMFVSVNLHHDTGEASPSDRLGTQEAALRSLLSQALAQSHCVIAGDLDLNCTRSLVTAYSDRYGLIFSDDTLSLQCILSRGPAWCLSKALPSQNTALPCPLVSCLTWAQPEGATLKRATDEDGVKERAEVKGGGAQQVAQGQGTAHFSQLLLHRLADAVREVARVVEEGLLGVPTNPDPDPEDPDKPEWDPDEPEWDAGSIGEPHGADNGQGAPGNSAELPAASAVTLDTPGNLQCLAVCKDGIWELERSETSHTRAMELLEIRDQVAKEAIKLQSGNCADRVPPGYVLEGSFISKCHRILRDERMLEICTNYWMSRTSFTDVGMNATKRHQAYTAYLHKRYNGKIVVDWILRHGPLDADAVEALNQETARIRQHTAEGAAKSRPFLRGPVTAAAVARTSRRRLANQHNYELRVAAAQRNRWGDCDVAGCESHGRALVMCYWCQRQVCSRHRVPGYIICLDCDNSGKGRTVQINAKLPADRARPLLCEGQMCHQTQLIGRCYDCNRYLCSGCSLPERVPHCIVCPALAAAFDRGGMSLKVPPVTQSDYRKRSAAMLLQEANSATERAGVGRLIGSGFAPGSHNSASGFVDRAGKRWCTWQAQRLVSHSPAFGQGQKTGPRIQRIWPYRPPSRAAGGRQPLKGAHVQEDTVLTGEIGHVQLLVQMLPQSWSVPATALELE